MIWYSHWYTNRADTTPPLPEKLDELNTQKADSIGLLTLPRDRFGYFSKQLVESRKRKFMLAVSPTGDLVDGAVAIEMMET